MLQISGHVTDEEGKKRIALVGKWNSYLDMQKCDEEGAPLPGSELVRLWTVSNASILSCGGNISVCCMCIRQQVPTRELFFVSNQAVLHP